MALGKHQHRLTLQRRSRTTDGGGGAASSWTDVDTVFGRIESTGGSERLFGDQVEGRTTNTITIRHRRGLNTDYRVKYSFDVRDKPIAFTAEGNAKISTAQSKFGGSSLLLDGTGDYLSTTVASGFMASDFTVEMFIRSADLSQISYLWDGHSSGVGTAIYINNNRWLFVKNNGLAGNVAANLTVDTWHHIALVRESGTLSGYVDGTRVGQATSTLTTDMSSHTIAVGGQVDGSNTFNGYIDEFRTSDTARYTGTSVTAPTAEFAPDANGISLLHFNGDNNSTTIDNDGKLISSTSYERIFNINRIENVGERDRYLKLYCTEGVAT